MYMYTHTHTHTHTHTLDMRMNMRDIPGAKNLQKERLYADVC